MGHFRKIQIFQEKLGSVPFDPLLYCNFMQEIRKILEVIWEYSNPVAGPILGQKTPKIPIELREILRKTIISQKIQSFCV